MPKPRAPKDRRIVVALGLIGLIAFFLSKSGDKKERGPGENPRTDHAGGVNSMGSAKEGPGASDFGNHALSEVALTPARLGGVVLSPTGSAVADALVLAMPINMVNGDPLQTTSQNDGRFTFNELVPGTYKISATSPGYAGVSSSELLLASGDQRDDLTLQLSGDGFTLSGIVEDSGGGPIPGAQINANLGWNNSSFRTQTDGDGRYLLTLLPGSYRVRANAEMYASESHRLQLSTERELDFKLTPAATLHGRVLERGSATGVAEASVRLHDTKGWQWRQRSVMTNTEGFFSFEDVDPGNYELSAHKGNLYGTHNLQIAVTVASSTRDLTIEMDKGFTISGQIKDARGQGIAQASVVARDRSLRSSRFEVASGPNGYYEVQGLPPGRYSLRAKAEGFSNERRKELSIIDQDLKPIDLTLQEGVQISGRLQNEANDPVVNAMIRGTSNEGFWFFRGFDEDQTQDDGTFHLKNLPVGDIKIRASHTLEGATTEVVEGLAPGEHRKDIILTLKAGTEVTGVVTWDDGTAADGVLVYARDTKRGRGDRAPETITDQDGSFRLSPLWSGQFQVWATTRVSNGWRPYPGTMGSTVARVSLDADNPLATVTLVIEAPDQMIQGRVLDPEGNPLPDCQVGATRELDNRKTSGRWRGGIGEETTQSAVDGSFTLSNLPKGTYTLSAVHPNYPQAKSKNVAAGTSDFIFRLQQGASLAGVVKRGGVPVTSYDITASTGNQSMRRHARLPGAKVSDPGGAFLIQGLPADNYTLTVETSDGSAGRLEGIELGVGEKRSGLAVILNDGAELVGKVIEYATDQPLAGVQIFASSPGGRYSAQTDEEGVFTLTGIAQGSTVGLYIAADRSLYIPDSHQFTASQPQTDLGILQVVRAPQEAEERFPLPLSFKSKSGVHLAQVKHEESGVLIGDTLLSVNGAPVQGVGNQGLRSLLERPLGQQTTLVLSRQQGSDTFSVTLTHQKPL